MWKATEVGTVSTEEKAETSFSNFSAYGRAVAQTPRRLVERLTAVFTAEEELTVMRERSGGEMQRKLDGCDVVAMGVGAMLGAGIFVTTGSAANQIAGPAVILSYGIAGFSAFLSACCYTEFAVEVPAAGGAFSYVRITFGEFAAYLTGMNLIMEYVISNAAVARSFTSHLATVFGVQNSNAWRLQIKELADGFNMLDPPAVLLITLLTICICRSTKGSSRFNLIMTLLHLVLIIFIIVAGFVNGTFKNLIQPASPVSPGGFTPFGARGVFAGAAVVYFSYIGYDAVSTMAEEVKHPSKNMPLGISGSVFVVTVLYCLLATAVAMLLPYDKIDPNAPFSMAFRRIAGWTWASSLVGLGASVGILSSLLVAMLGQARYMCVLGRANVIPFWFAEVNVSTGTPVNSSLFLGACTAIIALFTDLLILVDLISIGTLFVFYMVSNALIFRRHVTVGITNPWPTVAFLVAMSASSFGFVCFWQLKGDYSWELIILAFTFLAITVFFWAFVPRVHHHPNKWDAPLMPWLAAASIFLNVFLMGSLNQQAYIRFGVWSAGAVIFYILYTVHATYDAHIDHSVNDLESVTMEMHPQTIH